jgi:hypothetical protein
VTLTAEEAGLVAALAGQVVRLLAPEEGGPDESIAAEGGSVDPLEALVGMSGTPQAMPDDPALRRLLPDAYGDPAEAAEFRRLTDSELRQGKSDALRQLVADVSGATPGKSLNLVPDAVEIWLQAINDVRLVLGTRLDVREDMTEVLAGVGPDDPRVPLLLAYDWLGGVQQSLVEALDG